MNLTNVLRGPLPYIAFTFGALIAYLLGKSVITIALLSFVIAVVYELTKKNNPIKIGGVRGRR